MNNLRSLIKSFFHEACPVQAICQFRNQLTDGNFQESKVSVTSTRGLSDFINYSENELYSLDQKFNEDWQYIPNKNKAFGASKFNTLIHFTQQVLVEELNEPFVVYHNLLKWKDISIHLGEDILTTASYAFNDLKSLKKRYFYSWKPFLFTDNKRLKSILSQGIAENHSHLNAAGLNFDFSWIAIMNNYDTLKPELKKFSNSERKHGKTSYEFNHEKIEFCDLIEYAVIIRLLLSYSIQYFEKPIDCSLIEFLDQKLNLKNLLVKIFHNDNVIEQKIVSNNINNEIDYIKNQWSHRLKSGLKTECFDYLMPKNITEDNFDQFYYLYGERKLLYDCFKIIFNVSISNCVKKNFESLFNIYLLIKNDFRKEMIQINGRYGFANFKKYQDDKFNFIGKSAVNTDLYLNAYFDVIFNIYPKQMKIISNEFRISPPQSPEKFKKVINYYSSVQSSIGYFNKKVKLRYNNKAKINKNESESPFYVIHFFKSPEDLSPNAITNTINCRHFKLRNTIRKQAFDIVKVRETYPEISSKIRGIDAASSEFSARPEVYGQAFRYLRNHYLREEDYIFKKNKSNKLRLTFHAGEDFYDIADGLRYIDECIKFLGMCDGDRIGHALALGIDVKHYYNLKSNIILLPKQILLDNLVWILNKVKKFGLLAKHITIIQKLESLFNALASEIYINPILENYFERKNLNGNLSVFYNLSYTHQLFYDAWKLRGDNPIDYYDYFSKNLKELGNTALNYWERCGINSASYKYDLLRQRKDVCFLYHEYHYNDFLKKKGREIKQFTITDGYKNLVIDLQYNMMFHVSKRNIAIECNPSSNYLIGTVDKYIQHPIFKFNSKGLNFSDNFNSPLLSVSVNTDDAGIFHTSLENEYALLAIALEKEKDENGNPKFKPNDIYDWIDHVRKMGIHQSFKG